MFRYFFSSSFCFSWFNCYILFWRCLSLSVRPFESYRRFSIICFSTSPPIFFISSRFFWVRDRHVQDCDKQRKAILNIPFKTNETSVPRKKCDYWNVSLFHTKIKFKAAFLNLQWLVGLHQDWTTFSFCVFRYRFFSFKTGLWFSQYLTSRRSNAQINEKKKSKDLWIRRTAQSSAKWFIIYL